MRVISYFCSSGSLYNSIASLKPQRVRKNILIVDSALTETYFQEIRPIVLSSHQAHKLMLPWKSAIQHVKTSEMENKMASSFVSLKENHRY